MNGAGKAEATRARGDGQTAASPPAISLPKGGGVICGMGETFDANPVTGTGSMTVPIATSPGRSGFGPQLAVSYDSGAGNGPYGFGWSLCLPSITRKTNKALPTYEDADESDVFILSGAEDLVPVFKTDPTTGEFVKDARGNFVYDESPREKANEFFADSVMDEILTNSIQGRGPESNQPHFGDAIEPRPRERLVPSVIQENQAEL